MEREPSAAALPEYVDQWIQSILAEVDCLSDLLDWHNETETRRENDNEFGEGGVFSPRVPCRIKPRASRGASSVNVFPADQLGPHKPVLVVSLLRFPCNKLGGVAKRNNFFYFQDAVRAIYHWAQNSNSEHLVLITDTWPLPPQEQNFSENQPPFDFLNLALSLKRHCISRRIDQEEYRELLNDMWHFYRRYHFDEFFHRFPHYVKRRFGFDLLNFSSREMSVQEKIGLILKSTKINCHVYLHIGKNQTVPFALNKAWPLGW